MSLRGALPTKQSRPAPRSWVPPGSLRCARDGGFGGDALAETGTARLPKMSLRGALATKQSRPAARCWFRLDRFAALAMTVLAETLWPRREQSACPKCHCEERFRRSNPGLRRAVAVRLDRFAALAMTELLDDAATGRFSLTKFSNRFMKGSCFPSQPQPVSGQPSLSSSMGCAGRSRRGPPRTTSPGHSWSWFMAGWVA
jgi:hypothetical protein